MSLSDTQAQEAVAVQRGGRAKPLSRVAALLLALRPKQWTKNAVLFAALLFTLDKKHGAQDFINVGAGFLVFCLLSGCVYLLNDIVDVEADRKHPKKRNRPIASGRLPIPTAWAAFAVLLPLSLVGAWFVNPANPKFFLTAAVYFLIQLAYSFHLKHVVLLDLFALASGFVLRAAAGSFAIGVPNSEWLLLCTLLLALFLGLTKRRGELAALGDSPATRRILADYSLPMLEQMITIVSAVTMMAYSLYTFTSVTGKERPWMMLTIPYVIYGIFRYLYLTHRKGLGEAPDAVLLEDKPLLINIALFILTSLLVILGSR